MNLNDLTFFQVIEIYNNIIIFLLKNTIPVYKTNEEKNSFKEVFSKNNEIL